jgi:soluble lytic murein transglycosylase
VTAIRPFVLWIAGSLIASLLAAAAYATPPSGPIPVPKTRPAVKSDRTVKAKSHKAEARAEPTAPKAPSAKAPSAKALAPKAVSAKSLSAKAQEPKSLAGRPLVPISLTPSAPAASFNASIPEMPVAPMRPAPAFVMAPSSSTSPLDLNAVKQALVLVHKGQTDAATGIESSISDPAARKLVEWAILRSEDNGLDFSRYAAFINANPSWPNIMTLRRRAEAALWQERTDPASVIVFFHNEPPHSAKGHFALARALLARGDSAGAQQAVREAWYADGFSADLEEQARDAFAGLITADDDKARMDKRLYAEDDDGGLRAAHHLDAVAVAIARARAAVIDKSANAKSLLDAVPAAAQRDPGYMFSRIQWLRRTDDIAAAAQWMMAVPHDPAVLGDVDQWWVERRLIARKLLDLGEDKLAYEVASGAAPPVNENYRAEQQFTAGWIALRFLHEPAVALAHFAHVADGVANPITLARSYYWQGRAAEAAHQQDARAYYEAAARYPTAYYGQLARARLGVDEVTLRPQPEPPAQLRSLEIARAFEILYAIDERDMVASMAADLGEKATDAGALATLAEIATRHNDARTTLLIGKAALGRGLPFEHYAFPDFGVPNYQPIGPEVERCVVYSIVRQESAFNPRIASSANALGLMQVTPAAGRDTARKFNVAFNQRRLMDDVSYNAQLGSAELGSDISSYGGSYILAFAAYNAGRGRVKQWIDQYGDPRDPKVDPIDWIERIPISETRNYVERVVENMQVYRARIENNSRLLIEADLRRGG